MADIYWEPYIPSKPRSAHLSTPKISISQKSGRITLNSAISQLLPDIYSYKFAELSCGLVDGKLQKIRLQFTNEKNFKTIPLSRKKTKGVYSGGAVLHAKALVSSIYATYPTLKSTSHFLIDEQSVSSHITPSLSFDLVTSLID